MKSLLTLLGWLAIGTSAHAAPPSWWSPLPFESSSDLPSDLQDRIDKAVTRADLFAPLWVEVSYLAQMKAAFGAPDLEGVEGADWIFSNVMVRIDETQPGIAKITLAANADTTSGLRTFDPARVAFGVYAPATKSCVDAVPVLGKPSKAVSGEHLEWSTLGRGRDATIAVLCVDPHMPTFVSILLTKPTPEQLTRLERVNPMPPLPQTFVSTQSSKPADPRSLWPRALVPGQPVSVALADLGPPGWIARNVDAGTDHLHYGNSLRIDCDPAGRIAAVAINSHAAQLTKHFTFKSPIIASVGGASAALTTLLGAPSETALRRQGWYWDAAGHELAVEASTEEHHVTGLVFKWLPPVDPTSLPCATALSAPPSPTPSATMYRAPDTGLRLAGNQLLPFGLWLGATPRDVVDRMGPPRTCDSFRMGYRGVDLTFDDDKLTQFELLPKLLVPEHRERKDPLVAMLLAQDGSLYAALGIRRDARNALFERGDEYIFVGHDDDPAQPFYTAHLYRGFAYDGIEGIDLLQLEASKFLTMSRPDGSTTAEIPLAAKTALAGQIQGRFMDLLGAPWTTLLAALGQPTGVITTKTELLITWRWLDDPFGRSIAYRCSGATPMCDTLVLGTDRNHLGEGTP